MHVRLLRRYSDTVTLLFDPDAAGAQATLRGGELLIAEAITTNVVTLPDGLDPDELLVRDGRESLQAQLDHAVPFIDYVIAQALKRHPYASPEGKLAVSKDVLPLIRKVRDPLLQDEHLTRLAEALSVDKGVLGRQMKLIKADPQPAQEIKLSSSAKPTSSALLTVEEEIFVLTLLYPSAAAAKLLDPVVWKDPRSHQVWLALRSAVASGTVQLPDILPSLSQEIQDWLTSLAMQRRSYARPLETLHAFLETCEKQQMTAVLKTMQTEIDSMIEGRVPMDAKKVQQYHDLSRRLKGSTHG